MQPVLQISIMMARWRQVRLLSHSQLVIFSDWHEVILNWLPPRAVGLCQLFCYHCVSVLLHNNKFCVHTARSTMSARQQRIAVAVFLHTDNVSMTVDKDRMNKAESIFCHLLRQKSVCTTFKEKLILYVNIRLIDLNCSHIPECSLKTAVFYFHQNTQVHNNNSLFKTRHISTYC